MDAARAIAKSLTHVYVAGLVLMGLLSGAVHLLLNNVIVAQGDAPQWSTWRGDSARCCSASG